MMPALPGVILARAALVYTSGPVELATLTGFMEPMFFAISRDITVAETRFHGWCLGMSSCACIVPIILVNSGGYWPTLI